MPRRRTPELHVVVVTGPDAAFPYVLGPWASERAAHAAARAYTAGSAPAGVHAFARTMRTPDLLGNAAVLAAATGRHGDAKRRSRPSRRRSR